MSMKAPKPTADPLGPWTLPTWRFMGSYKWVISRVTVVITHTRGFITTHEPPSTYAIRPRTAVETASTGTASLQHQSVNPNPKNQ